MAFTANVSGIPNTVYLGTISVSRVTESDFFTQIYSTDLDNVFMNTSEFAELITYTHSLTSESMQYAIIFDNPYLSMDIQSPIKLNSIRMHAKVIETNLHQPIAKDDYAVIRGIKYIVDDFHSDGVGVTTLYFRIK